MSDPTEEAERNTELLLEATKQLRASLRATETVYRRALRNIQRHVGVTPTLRANHADVARLELTTALNEFERQRHKTRISFIAIQLAEGDSIAEIGRTWGFSRQLAATFARRQETTIVNRSCALPSLSAGAPMPPNSAARFASQSILCRRARFSLPARARTALTAMATARRRRNEELRFGRTMKRLQRRQRLIDGGAARWPPAPPVARR